MGMPFEEFVAQDVSGFDAAATRLAMSDVARFRGRLDVVLGRLVARAETLAATGEGPDAARMIAKQTKVSAKEAEWVRKRAKVLTDQPGLDDSLADGEVSAEHVDVIASVTANLTDDERTTFTERAGWLHQQALVLPPEQFRRVVQNMCDQIREFAGERAARQKAATKVSTWWNQSTGMFNIRGEFDPETGTAIDNALKAYSTGLKNRPDITDLDHAQRDAVAVAEMLLGTARDAKPGFVEAIIIIDNETLEHGIHDASVCEYSSGATLPVHSARRLLCRAARITWISVDQNGAPLQAGFTERHANRKQRRMLRSMYRTCAIEGCGVLFDRCEIHHVIWYENDGPTDLDNLAPLCPRHHHLVHEGGWRLLMDKARTLTLIRPDGHIDTRTAFTPPYPPRTRRSTPEHEPTLIRTG